MQTRRISFGLDPSGLAREFGTPLYIINLDTLEYNFLRFDRALIAAGIDHKIFYAVKANPLLAVLRRILQLGGGAEVVSLGELEAARRAGFPPMEVVFNGPGKNAAEIEAAVDWGVASINVESVGELERVARACRRISKPANVGFRINPGTVISTHNYLQTGLRGGKFGLDLRSFKEALRVCKKTKLLNPACVHMHLGSQISSIHGLRSAYRRLLSYVRLFRKTLRTSPSMVDVGGGFGLDYSTGRAFVDPEEYVKKALGPTVSSRTWPASCKVAIEPGRSLIAQAGVLAMTVLYVKQSGGTRWLITDSGMSDFIRTALYSDRHRIVNASRPRGRTRNYFVGGPVCESGDALGCYSLPNTEPGDILLLLDAGAYGSSMSNNYNGRLRPVTVAISNGRAWPCERRETLEDLFRRQSEGQ